MIPLNACIGNVDDRADEHIKTQKAPMQAKMDADLQTWFRGTEQLYIEKMMALRQISSN